MLPNLEDSSAQPLSPLAGPTSPATALLPSEPGFTPQRLRAPTPDRQGVGGERLTKPMAAWQLLPSTMAHSRLFCWDSFLLCRLRPIPKRPHSPTEKE